MNATGQELNDQLARELEQRAADRELDRQTEALTRIRGELVRVEARRAYLDSHRRQLAVQLVVLGMPKNAAAIRAGVSRPTLDKLMAQYEDDQRAAREGASAAGPVHSARLELAPLGASAPGQD